MGSSSSNNYSSSTEKSDTTIEDETLSTSQESVPVPWLAGERKIAVNWITRVYNQRAQETPDTTTVSSKK